MACCVFTAYLMSRIIKACEILDVQIYQIQYNDASYDLPKKSIHSSFKTEKFTLDGMTCAACTATIEAALLGLKGIQRVAVSLPLSRATVVLDSSIISSVDVIRVIEDSGYGATLGDRSIQDTIELLENADEIRYLRSRFRTAALLSSALVTVRYMPTEMVQHMLRRVEVCIGLWIHLYEASFIHRHAWFRNDKLSVTTSMDLLISLSLLFGLVLSFFNIYMTGLNTAQTYFSSGSFLATVVRGSRYIDLLLKKKSTANLSMLYQLQSDTATFLVSTSNQMHVPAALLLPQDEIVIKPDTVIPCDSYILSGTTLLDQSLMTGEPRPVRKRPGDFLMSGMRNISSPVHAVVVKNHAESSLNKLISGITSATEATSGDRHTGDRVLRNFVKGVLLLTLLRFSWILSGHGRYNDSLGCLRIACEGAMAMLAAACPCALGLAKPSAILAALDAAWSRGVVLAGGFRTLENLSNLTHVVMDKTGTLTEGRISVSACRLRGDSQCITLFDCMLLCAAERHDAQSHPIGQAVFQWALGQLDDKEGRQQNLAEVRKDPLQTSNGIECEIKLAGEAYWTTVHIGNETFLHDHGICIPDSSYTVGSSVVHFAFNKSYTGGLVLEDKVRSNVSNVIQALRHRELSITMLTGDSETEASRVSRLLSIPVLSSSALPLEKKTHVETLQSQGHIVAMVGDGLNDIAAQASADVGIHLSLSPSHRSRAVADTIILSPDLARLPEMINIAKKVTRQTKWMTWWAFAYNGVAMALAMGLAERWGVVLDPAAAGTMMAGSSVSVLGMGLWLRRELRVRDL